MGAHQDLVQRAVVLAVAVVSALLNGALNALVGVAVHSCFLLCLSSKVVCPKQFETHMEKIVLSIAFKNTP